MRLIYDQLLVVSGDNLSRSIGNITTLAEKARSSYENLRPNYQTLILLFSLFIADQMQARIPAPFMKPLAVAPVHHEAATARQTSIKPNHNDH